MKNLKTLFERRAFGRKENDDLDHLYSFGYLFAAQVQRILPTSDPQYRAILKIREALSECETALVVDARCDRQLEMAFAECQGAGT